MATGRRTVLCTGQVVVILDEQGRGRDPEYPHTYTLQERRMEHGQFQWTLRELPPGTMMPARRLQPV